MESGRARVEREEKGFEKQRRSLEKRSPWGVRREKRSWRKGGGNVI